MVTPTQPPLQGTVGSPAQKTTSSKKSHSRAAKGSSEQKTEASNKPHHSPSDVVSAEKTKSSNKAHSQAAKGSLEQKTESSNSPPSIAPFHHLSMDRFCK